MKTHGRDIHVGAWRMMVGRVPVYFLDTNLAENDPEDRELASKLYAGGPDLRLRQEWILGVGGVRVLRAVGIEPSAWHANEGHAAFMLVERVRELVLTGVEFEEAVRRVRASSVFTTHTPVPAGHDAFQIDQVAECTGRIWNEMKVSREQVLEFGRHPVENHGQFHMTVTAIRLSSHVNGVAKRHGEVSRDIWRTLWPDRPADRVPIGHVTNGVHLGTWLDPGLTELLRAAGVTPEAPPDDANWDAARHVDSEALWQVHLAAKAHLAERAGIDRELLTIGFARRFATYKRAGLIFSDLERLLALPVQVVVAGKAHPADDPGKDVMQGIVELARDQRLAGRVVFLENYDMGLARTLVRGCDVWLNTPRRPLEASGTSGMKAAANGVLNLSVLDGWWAEAYAPALGWAIEGVSDDADREQLYRLLEDEVVPAFTDRRDQWVEMMKESIARLAPHFSMHRAVIEYAERYYLPAHAHAQR